MKCGSQQKVHNIKMAWRHVSVVPHVWRKFFGEWQSPSMQSERSCQRELSLQRLVLWLAAMSKRAWTYSLVMPKAANLSQCAQIVASTYSRLIKTATVKCARYKTRQSEPATYTEVACLYLKACVKACNDMPQNFSRAMDVALQMHTLYLDVQNVYRTKSPASVM